jgi:CRP-like cAMP-binding protein
MPDLDGYSVIHILNNDEKTAGTPFIFLTAKADKKDFRTGMNLGADDYITKPFDGLDLLKVVEMRLKKGAAKKTDSSGSNTPEEQSLLQNLKEVQDFQDLAANRQVKTFKKKDLIYMEGQNPNHLFRIEKGQVKTFKVNYFGKELITGIYRTGDFIGYIPLLENKAYNENAEALEEVQVSVIPKADFLDLIESNKEVAKKFINMMSSGMEDLENRLLEIAYQTVRQRVASALLKLHAKSDSDTQLIISRRDLSNIVGTTTESLNRTLMDFKEEGLIDICPNGLNILNKPKLEKVVTL